MATELQDLELAGNLDIGIVVHAPDTRILYSNRRAGELLGLSEAQMQGKVAIDPAWTFFDAQGQKLAPDQYPVSRILFTLKPLFQQIGGIQLPGATELRWVLVSGFPEFDANGKLKQIVVNFYDISERQKSTEALRISETLYRTVFDTTPDAVIITRIPGGEYVDVNRAFLKTLGYARHEVIGKTPLDLNIWVSTADRQRLFETLQRDGICQDMEAQFRAKSGGLIWGQLSASFMEFHGERCLLSVTRDITARKRAEEGLQHNEQRLTTILERAADAIFIVNRSGDYQYVNQEACRMLGYPRETFLTMNIRDLTPHEQLEATQQDFARLLQTGSLRTELQLRRRDGSLLSGELNATLLPDGKLFGSCRDITERKRAEARLKESEGRLQALIHALPDLIWLKDKEGRYLACNQRFEAFFGAAQQDIVGKKDDDFVTREQAASFRKYDLIAMETGRVSVNEEWISFASDQHLELLETTKIRMSDPDGETIGVLGIGHDITQRKELENTQRESLARLKKIASRVPGVVYQYRLRPDGSSCFPFASEAIREIYRVTPEEVAEDATPVFHILHPEDFEGIVASVHKSAAELSPWYHEYRVRFEDGCERWLLGNALPERETDGSTLWHGFITDITERKLAEEKLQLAASVFTHAREGIMITSLSGEIIDINEAFTQITGYARDDIIGKDPRILNSGRHDREFFAAMWRSLIEKGHWYGEVWNRRKNGEFFAEMQTISTVRDPQGTPRQYLSLFSDITTLKEHEQRLEHIAHYDALTSLPNRVLLSDRMQQAMVQVLRRREKMAVAYLDLDGFKEINDTYGHEVGDQLLITIASRMKLALREGDTLARLGGDEFIAVILDLEDLAASVPMLTRLLQAAAQAVFIGDLSLQVSASLGVTFYPQAEEVDADHLLRQADQAMYQAKLTGKNRYHVFDVEEDRNVRGHHETLERMQSALAHQEFVLYYQPKVNMRSGSMIGVEALIRWQHPEKGILAPAAFLPVIDDHPLAVEVGEWVINAALTQMETWKSEGLEIPVSVNIGARQLQQFDFVERLHGILDAHPRISPALLELEVLETSALEDLTHVSSVIEQCKILGVGFALDDFGTGYSSLTYLKHLPVGLIKIDQSFVRDMLDDPDDLAILQGVIGLASTFRRQVIAEGVETEEHGNLLLNLGCDLAQGYGIARPMPAQDLIHWATHWKPDPTWQIRSRITSDDFPLLFAGVEHRAWMTALTHYLRGERPQMPPLSDHACRFGEWLRDGGERRYGTHPDFAEISAMHRTLHVNAVQLVALNRDLQKAEIEAGLAALSEISQRLLSELKVLLLDSRRLSR